MILPASGRELRRLVGWALPVLAGVFLAPAGARADCGDYVVTRLSHDMMASSSAQQAAGQLPPAAPRHKPCSGPHCSHAPVAPPARVPTTQRPTFREWGCVIADLCLAPLDPRIVFPEEQTQRPVRLSSAIFHPPRLAS
jgi:hypothetical protein